MNRFDQLLRLNCRFTEVRMDAYLKGELSVVQRHYVAHHIRRCAYCSAAYASQRRLSEELLREMPGFGRAQRQQIALIWLDVQRELAASPVSSASRLPYTAAASVAMLLLTLALVSGGQRQPAPDLANTANDVASLALTSTATPSPVQWVPVVNNTAAPSAIALQNTPDSSLSER